MHYNPRTKSLLLGRTTERTPLGVRLGRLAVKREVSVVALAKRLGASRTTLYSWFAGRGVSNAYRYSVVALIEELQDQKT